MKKFEHCNVLKLRGICFDEDNSPLVLLPFMSEGDLLSYIRNVKNILTLEDLLLFAVDIAKGSHNVIKMVIFLF
jgi:proto-oncogene tyrosine-protein kinase Met